MSNSTTITGMYPESNSTLHVKFEELYDEVTLKMDEVAERLLD